MPKKKASEIRVNDAWCKRCGICIAFCPTRVLQADSRGVPRVANLEACTVCLLCELRCPDFAIEVVEAADETLAAGVTGKGEARHGASPAHAG